MVAGTLNREARREPGDILGTAAAIAVRRTLLAGHPLEDAFYRILLSTSNTALTEAVRLAQGVPIAELLLSAARCIPATNADGWEDMADLAAKFGLTLSAPDIGGLPSSIRWSDLGKMVLELGDRGSKQLIREMAGR